MAQIDNGPATNNASLIFGGTPAASVEVHIPSGIDPLPAGLAPFVDPQAGTYQDVPATKGTVANTTNKAVQFGSLGTGIQFSLPA